MKRFVILSMAMVFLSVTPASAQYKKIEDSTGLETIRVGDTDMTVPKGSRVYRKNNLAYVEGLDQYAGRRFEEMETRLATIERNQNYLKSEIDRLRNDFNVELQQLKAAIDDLQTSNNTKFDKTSVAKEQISKEYGK